MRVPIHVAIEEELLERIDRLVSIGDMSKSEIVRRTLDYGIGEMEKAISRFVDKRLSDISSDRCMDLADEHDTKYPYDIQDDESL